jgi:hypothetical protein
MASGDASVAMVGVDACDAGATTAEVTSRQRVKTTRDAAREVRRMGTVARIGASASTSAALSARRR